MSKIHDEVLRANGEYVKTFGDKTEIGRAS